ncbi:MAG: hypothetical protein V4584_18525 [Verrucomicrobiota bacterium]
MAIPLESLDYDTFAALAGEVFTTTVGEVFIGLRLDEVRKLGHRRAEAMRDPFSISFLGPQGLRLPQGIYRFSNEALGGIELFIAQVADGARGSEFEAVFT